MEDMDAYYKYLEESETRLSTELGVSRECAKDILYLRTRHRHTQALEDELIALHKAGNPPCMMDFGVTEDTQAHLMQTVYDALGKAFDKE